MFPNQPGAPGGFAAPTFQPPNAAQNNQQPGAPGQPPKPMAVPSFAPAGVKPIGVPSFASPVGAGIPSMPAMPGMPPKPIGMPGAAPSGSPNAMPGIKPPTFAPLAPAPQFKPLPSPAQPGAQPSPAGPLRAANTASTLPQPSISALPTAPKPLFSAPSFTPKPIAPPATTPGSLPAPGMATASLPGMPGISGIPPKPFGAPPSFSPATTPGSSMGAPPSFASPAMPTMPAIAPAAPASTHLPPMPQQQQLHLPPQQSQSQNQGAAQQGYPPQPMPGAGLGTNNLPPPAMSGMQPLAGTSQPPGMQPIPGMPQPLSPGYNPSFAPPPPLPAQDNRPIIPAHVIPPNPRLLCTTTSHFPASQALLARAHLPMGLVLRPLADLPAGEAPVPVVDFGVAGVVRCLKCRAYLSAYARFQDNGQHWACSFCHALNIVPDAYYSPLDQSGIRQDISGRPELTESVYEVVATEEYHARPPMPPLYLFLLDVSQRAQASGQLATACHALEAVLDRLPGGIDSQPTNAAAKRVRVGVITFDSAVHLYEFRAGATMPRMLVQSDLDNLLLPAPSGLHVALDEYKDQVRALLKALPSIHKQSSDVEVAFGPALALAVDTIQTTGGKITCFLSGLPSAGKGRLLNRDARRPGQRPDPATIDRLLVREPNGERLYEALATAMSKLQICTDLFLCPTAGYIDVPTLHDLARLTGGETRVYEGFSAATHGQRMHEDVGRVLSRMTGWEAVVRLRVSQGVTVSDVLGNFCVRGSSLLVLPAIDADKTITFELRPDDSAVNQRCAYLQSALLYTTLNGERRIRVATTCIPITHTLQELLEGVSPNSLVNLMVKQTVAQVLGPAGGLNKAHGLLSRALNIMRAYGAVLAKPNFDYGPLGSLPIMCLGAAKSLGLREGTDVPLNTRSYVLGQMLTMGLIELETLVRPRLLPLHALSGEEGLPGAGGAVTLPAELSLSSSQLSPQGVFLLDNGMDMFLFVGAHADANILNTWFVAGPAGPKLAPAPGGDAPLQRVHNIIDFLRAASTFHQQLVVVRQGDPAPVALAAMLAEDVHGNTVSLAQFAALMTKGNVSG